MTIEAYGLYLLTVLVFFAHPPGPSQLLFVAGSLRHGARGALPIMAGDLSANTVQILAAGFGLVGLIALSAEAFLALKWMGVAYLVWMGVRIVRSAGRGSAGRGRAGPAAPDGRRLFRQGFLTSAANPYAVVFFAALFPQFIDPGAALAPQIAALGATYLVIDGAILLAMGAAAARLASALGGAFERWMVRASGATLIGTAVLLGLRDAPEPAR